MKILPSLVVALVTAAPFAVAGYEVKEITVKPATSYAAHQTFQNVAVGAEIYNSEAEVLEIFDTKKLCERGLMAVLLVVENNNEFALRIDERDIFLVDRNGTSIPARPVTEVLLTISGKKPPSGFSTPKDLSKSIKKEIRADFERKAFGEKLIAPYSSDFGVLFFPLTGDEELVNLHLYLPEILNITSGETLMFFEFSLGSLE